MHPPSLGAAAGYGLRRQVGRDAAFARAGRSAAKGCSSAQSAVTSDLPSQSKLRTWKAGAHGRVLTLDSAPDSR